MSGRLVTPSRIRHLLELHTHREVAAMLRISMDEVREAEEQFSGPRVPVTFWCNLSKRAWNAGSWRSAYLQVCILGLVDWGWCRTEVFKEWREAGGQL